MKTLMRPSRSAIVKCIVVPIVLVTIIVLTFENINTLKVGRKFESSITTTTERKLESIGKIFHSRQFDNNRPDTYAANDYQQQPLHTSNNERFNSIDIFLHCYRYFEQMGMGTNNIISLLGFAYLLHAQVVTPYVRNSRLSGVPQGTARYRNVNSIRYTNFSTYFDVPVLNDTLLRNNYSTLLPFSEFIVRCKRTLHVLIHFLYEDSQSDYKAMQWYHISESKLDSVKREVKTNKRGWTLCPFIAKANIGRQLGYFKVERYVCVDPSQFTSVEDFKRRVLKNDKCVGIVQWKGIGNNRTNFNISRKVSLRPYQFPHNKELISIADEYILKHDLRFYVGIHVRFERVVRKDLQAGIWRIKKCLRQLKHKFNEVLRGRNMIKSFLSTDVSDYGSDTIYRKDDDKDRKRKKLYNIARAELPRSYVFNSSSIDDSNSILVDHGAVAIVEMHILSRANILFVVGGGNFQQWVKDLYMSYHPHNSKIISICQYPGSKKV